MGYNTHVSIYKPSHTVSGFLSLLKEKKKSTFYEIFIYLLGQFHYHLRLSVGFLLRVKWTLDISTWMCNGGQGEGSEAVWEALSGSVVTEANISASDNFLNSW